MSESANINQFILRFVSLIEINLAAKMSRKFIADECKNAWMNGWREAEWFAGLALMGTGMENINNPAAMFTSQLKETAAMVCPVDRTSQPPSIEQVRAEMNRAHQPAKNPQQHINVCRQALTGENR